MESAILIHPALEFLLTVLPLAPDCPTTDQKPAPRRPHPCPSSGADLWVNSGAVWGKTMRQIGAVYKSINFYYVKVSINV